MIYGVNSTEGGDNEATPMNRNTRANHTRATIFITEKKKTNKPDHGARFWVQVGGKTYKS